MITRVATWLANEPVRTYLYAVGVAALLILNAYAFVSDEDALLWGNFLAAALVPAVEKARRRVRPQFPKHHHPHPHKKDTHRDH